MPMTATAMLGRPAVRTLPISPTQAPPVVLAGHLLGQQVAVQADRPLPATANHLLDHLNKQWDGRRRQSDLDRVSNSPNVVISVSAPTRLLLRNALKALRLADLAGLNYGPWYAILDDRHGRIGADPQIAAMMGRLAPATAADLLAESCLAAGASAGSIRVGAAIRVLDDPLEAWLRQAGED